MNRKLLILPFLLSCSSFQPADPLLVEHALQNETDNGFISREFFQIKVEVPYSSLETSGKERRENCKQKALILREELSIPYLLQAHRDKYRFGTGIEEYQYTSLGKQRSDRKAQEASQALNSNPAAAITSGTAPQTATNSTGTTASGTTNTGQNQQQKDGSGALVPSSEGSRPYVQNFIWFFDTLTLYKEDYTDRTKCAFLFRNIQEKLYTKVESTPLPEKAYLIPMREPL
ncbi:hypothetical protein [Leptospira idonii]|uniref:Lipoprotein n=1 Tax=Leptospira idonii TaxID=1193500 RepID=A0A4R9M2L0_9LEPT|nr:hypothetical protein [Leptospira idonii]TGN20115.1 hypothetical protein EHS15_05310 [Leptospira idonii]